MMKKIRVLVIDDSALFRNLLTRILESDPEIEVCGSARDPYEAREKIKRLNPDVITLDVEMPNMDGITFLRNLMRLHPMPVVMISSYTEKGAEVTLQALELGAIDFICKPTFDAEASLERYAQEIVAKLKMSASIWQCTGFIAPKQSTLSKSGSTSITEFEKVNNENNQYLADSLIAIGASTGGTSAIRIILHKLPSSVPGIVITQHMPARFSKQFAKRLNDQCNLMVSEAETGQPILPGHVYIAPGDAHLMVDRDSDVYRCRLDDGPRVNYHMPSVDVLFQSVANNAGSRAIGVLLTGMGNDGSQGMKEMHNTGASTIAQDERSSVVWGMPGSAYKLGAVDSLLPLDIIPEKIMTLLNVNYKK